MIAQLRGRYHQLYRHREWNSIRRRYQDQYGWKTTAANRVRVFDAIAKSLREGLWTPNEGLLEEMATVVIKDDGKIEHIDGCHDDRVFAAGIAQAVHYDSPRYTPDFSSLKEGLPNTESAWMAV